MSKFMDRDFKGIHIDRELYLDRSLSWTEKILIIEIDSLDVEKEKGCFASNRYLADFLGIAPGTLKNLITKLKKKGLIKEVFYDIGKRRGLTTFLREKRKSNPSQKNDGRGHKNVPNPSQKRDDHPSQKNDNSKTLKESDDSREEERGGNGKDPFEEVAPDLLISETEKILKISLPLDVKKQLSRAIPTALISQWTVFAGNRAVALAKNRSRDGVLVRLSYWLTDFQKDFKAEYAKSYGHGKPAPKFTHEI